MFIPDIFGGIYIRYQTDILINRQTNLARANTATPLLMTINFLTFKYETDKDAQEVY